MATLSESIAWPDGIYQIETTDPVMGGPEGIDNQQGKELAQRTRWLRAEIARRGLAHWRRVDLQTMFGIDGGLTRVCAWGTDYPSAVTFAVGNGGALLRSSFAADNWDNLTDTLYLFVNFSGIAVADSTQDIVIVGDNGFVASSSDLGATLIARTADGSYIGDFSHVIYLPEIARFVAFGEDGEVQTSDDHGVTWTRRVWGGDANDAIQDAAFDGQKIVAVGVSDTDELVVRVSADGGVTWSAAAITGAVSSSQSSPSVAFGDGRWVIIAVLTLLTSADGLSWSAEALSWGPVSALTYHARLGLFVASSPSTPLYLLTSEDGVTWRPISGWVGGDDGFSLVSNPVSMTVEPTGGSVVIADGNDVFVSDYILAAGS